MTEKRPRAQFEKETNTQGEFVRQQSMFRRHVEAHSEAQFPAASGRYHLYVSYACPWAHRTIIARKLKGLEDAVSMTVVDPIRDERGWAFTDESGPDPLNGFQFLSEAYRATEATFSDRVTVPVLWDKQTQQIVNNESSEILRMLNTSFDEWAQSKLDLYPESLRGEIDEVNQRVYSDINNGVYRCGFASTQSAYDKAFDVLFRGLDWLEDRLSSRERLVGDQSTEADWRLFTTLIRFDPVYVGHFKCNQRRIADYPHLSRYLSSLYQTPGVAETVNMDHIKRHYYVTHRSINPYGIVPKGPALDFA